MCQKKRSDTQFHFFFIFFFIFVYFPGDNLVLYFLHVFTQGIPNFEICMCYILKPWILDAQENQHLEMLPSTSTL